MMGWNLVGWETIGWEVLGWETRQVGWQMTLALWPLEPPLPIGWSMMR